MSKIADHVALLKDAGFKTAAAHAHAKAERARKLALAYEHYRYVSEEKIEAFQEKLKAETLRRTGRAGSDLYEHYDKLCFTTADRYDHMPPADVLKIAKEAQARGIFDTLEVAHVESVREYKDPILFGLINGCSDRFYLAQWGSNVSITDLLGENDG